MSRGGENSRRPKRRWVLRCRRGIKLGLIRNEKPFVVLGLSSDWGRRLAELEGMLCSSVSPAGFGGVNFPLPWTREEFFSCRRRIFSQLPFAKGGDYYLRTSSKTRCGFLVPCFWLRHLFIPPDAPGPYILEVRNINRSAQFIRFGGRIPAPLTSLNN
jgi:hypothetical protein